MVRQQVMNFFHTRVYEIGHFRWKKWSLGLLLAVLSGVLLGLAFPLTSFFPLAWVAFVPLLVMQRGVPVWRMWFYAFMAGLSFWLVHASWLKVFHPLSLVTATPALALYFSLPFVFMAVFRRRMNNRFPLLQAFLFATLWIGVEYFRSTGFLGFSWGVVGYSQQYFLPVLQIADIGGVWSVSCIVLFANAVIANWLVEGYPIVRKRFLVLAGVLVFVLGYGVFRLTEEPSGPVKRVALVQAFVDPAVDWKQARADATMQKIEEMTIAAGQHEPRPDLVVWSETLSSPSALWYYTHLRKAAAGSSQRAIGEWFMGMPARAGRPVLLTAPHKEFVAYTNEKGLLRHEIESYNAAFLVTETTNIVDRYYKINLVPFGEWFPYKKEFPWIAKILEKTIASDFTPGKRYTAFSMPQGRFGVLICFEDIFGEICRQLVLAGAEYLINTTNDYWSKSIQSQEQHAAMAVLRAVENRRFLVRAANTGVTCVVDPWGRMLQRLPNEETGILHSGISLMRGRGPTFYTLHGDWAGIAGAWACALAGVAGMGVWLTASGRRIKKLILKK
ncbi:MAG TPA: apolipoprotein N-acyltransferase [Spirochaetota bacterium]|nr:apolipoprotein N-acyltransferase [Spirochaetota bacterium]